MDIDLISKRFRDKKVAILGAGKEGLAMAKFLSGFGAKIEIRDQDGNKKFFIKNQAPKEALIVVGMSYLENLNEFDFIIRSPGIPWLNSELENARQSGVEVISQIELFLQYCPCKVVGVTGTKGKSTTSTLIAEILRSGGENVRLGGNIGEVIIDWLNEIENNDVVVLELSSFQLQGLTVSPNISVVLDITTEHLDHHKSVVEYSDAKSHIVKNQKHGDFAILDYDSITSSSYVPLTKATVSWFSGKHEVINGAYYLDGKYYYNDGKAGEIVVDSKDVRLFGRHNYSNVAAAITAAKLMGIKNEIIISVLKKFSGLPHRLQKLGLVAGRDWVDDAYATAPDATIAALESLTSTSMILIVGGSSKGYGFDMLADRIIKRKPKTVIAIGQTGHEISALIKNGCGENAADCPVILEGAKNMNEIIDLAMNNSAEGDTILFSPGCASFGMFKNAADRANQFVDVVSDMRQK